MNQNNYDVIIIGAGPAGLSASIYLRRANLNILVLEKKAPGGTLNIINRIENYPGYTDVVGSTLAYNMYNQALQLDTQFKTESVISISKEDIFLVKTPKNTYKSKYIIIASGKIPRKLETKNSEKFEGKGISYCTTCDGALYKDKDVVVVGGGNSAMESSLYLSDIANKIYIINRSNTLRAEATLINQVSKKENIEIIYNSKITEVNGEKNITSVILNEDKILNVEGIFVCIGQEVNNSYYQDLNIKTDNLGIIVDNNMKTSVDGVYAAGDSISKNLYQVVTATSEGATASSNIIKNMKVTK